MGHNVLERNVLHAFIVSKIAPHIVNWFYVVVSTYFSDFREVYTLCEAQRLHIFHVLFNLCCPCGGTSTSYRLIYQPGQSTLQFYFLNFVIFFTVILVNVVTN